MKIFLIPINLYGPIRMRCRDFGGVLYITDLFIKALDLHWILTPKDNDQLVNVTVCGGSYLPFKLNDFVFHFNLF